MSEVNQSIKCKVDTCKYHDTTEYCTLNDIVVGADKCDCKNVSETKCLSFECGC